MNVPAQPFHSSKNDKSSLVPSVGINSCDSFLIMTNVESFVPVTLFNYSFHKLP